METTSHQSARIIFFLLSNSHLDFFLHNKIKISLSCATYLIHVCQRTGNRATRSNKSSSIGEAVVRLQPEPRCTRKKTVKPLRRRCLNVCVKVVRGSFKRPPTRMPRIAMKPRVSILPSQWSEALDTQRSCWIYRRY